MLKWRLLKTCTWLIIWMNISTTYNFSLWKPTEIMGDCDDKIFVFISVGDMTLIFCLKSCLISLVFSHSKEKWNHTIEENYQLPSGCRCCHIFQFYPDCCIVCIPQFCAIIRTALEQSKDRSGNGTHPWGAPVNNSHVAVSEKTSWTTTIPIKSFEYHNWFFIGVYPQGTRK